MYTANIKKKKKKKQKKNTNDYNCIERAFVRGACVRATRTPCCVCTCVHACLYVIAYILAFHS